MGRIEVPRTPDFDLYLHKEEIPSEWILSLIIRYKNVFVHHTDASGESHKKEAKGFYLLKTENPSIIIKRKDGKWSCSIKAYVDKVWHVGGTASIKLQAKITPIDIQEISERIGGVDLIVAWSISGWGFLDEEDAKIFGSSLVRIDASDNDGHLFSKKQFIKAILEPMDRFRREFIEITSPSAISISRTPQELKILVSLLNDRSIFLQDALKKFDQATNSREYAAAIGDVRRALGAMEKQLRSIKGQIAEKLFLEMDIVTGEGAEQQSRAIVDQLLGIIGGLEGIASGLGIHLETKERKLPKPYIPNPDNHDAKYIILMSMLTLSYLSERLRTFIIRRNF